MLSDSYELLCSIQSDISDRIDLKKIELDSLKEKTSFKIIDVIKVNNERNKLNKLCKLDRALDNICIDNNTNKLSNDLIDNINKLCYLINDNLKIELLLNNSIKEYNDYKNNYYKNKINNIIKLYKDLNIDDNNIKVFLNEYYNKKIANNYKFVKINFIKDEIDNNIFFNELDKLVRKNEVSNKIINNLNNIKGKYDSKIKTSKIIELCNDIIILLKSSDDINFNKLIEYITKIYNVNIREKKEIDKYLRLYDFNDIERKIENRIEKINENILKYEVLSYELEKTLKEEPNNRNKINILILNMKNKEFIENLSIDELKGALIKGLERYQNEKRNLV